MKNFNRRQFIKGVTAAAAGSAILSGCSRKPARWRFFTDQEAELVDLITEQIIPADQDPGASEAGVVYFIDKQLAGFYSKHQQTYRTGLAGVEETAQAMFGGRFASLKWDDQTAVLTALESGKARGRTWESASSAEFFSLICDHTMQGFYGSPRHGGNRNYASYRMLGLDYPEIIGQNRYRS